MKLSNWNTNIERVLSWLNTTENDISGVESTIKSIIGLAGTSENEELLGAYWTSIRNIGGQFDDFPKARVGQTSNYPEEVLMSVESVMNHVSSVFASVFDDILQSVMLPRGMKSRHETNNAFGTYYASSAQRVLFMAYDDGRWDGTLSKKGVPNVALIEVEETTE